MINLYDSLYVIICDKHFTVIVFALIEAGFEIVIFIAWKYQFGDYTEKKFVTSLNPGPIEVSKMRDKSTSYLIVDEANRLKQHFSKQTKDLMHIEGGNKPNPTLTFIYAEY